MAKLGALARSGLLRKSNESMRLFITTVIGVVFGFLVGISVPSVSMTKLHFPSSIISYIEDRNSGITTQALLNHAWTTVKSQNMNNSNPNVKDTLKIYVPTNPRGAESLPPGIVVSETDLYLRRLWGKPSEDLPMKQKYLVTFTVGYDQRHNIDAAVKKFSGNFTILLFHYDGRTTEWDEFEWSKRAIHVSTRKQTKWWYAKRFLHPDIVAQYEYIFIWDEDLGVEHFNAEEYIRLVRKHGLEISQPGLEPNKGLTWQMTKRSASAAAITGPGRKPAPRAEIAEPTAAMDADFFCQECKAFTQTVLDRSTGDTVCTECALVVDHHYVDVSSEWRVFADDTDGDDKVRVGGASNPLLGDEGGLAPTVIAKVNGKPALPSVARAQATDPHRALIQAFGTISAMASRLHLVPTIEHRAQEIYKNLKDQKSIVGKPQTAVLAACLFVACRLEHAPRTVNEIFSVANGAAKKKIGQAINIIEAEMGSSFEMGTARAGDFMRRFCSHLGMTNHAVKAAIEAVQNSEELDIRRAPLSVAAAVIYMITQLSDDKKQLRDISLATGVAEGTIKKAYKDLHPHASRLIPSSFAGKEDLRKLASP